MKRLGLLMLVMCVASLPVWAQSLTNCSFETGDLSGWTTCSTGGDGFFADYWTSTPSPYSVMDNSEVFNMGGQGAHNAGGGGGGNGGWTYSAGQDVTLSAGAHTIGTVWQSGFSASAELRAGPGAIGTYLCGATGGGTLVASSPGAIPWTEFGGTYSPASTGTYSLWVNLTLAAGGWGSYGIYTDGITIDGPLPVDDWILY